MTGRSNSKGECHHGGPRHRDPVLAAGSGGHPSDGSAVWPVSVVHRLPHPGGPGGQPGDRQRHLSAGLGLHAAPPAPGAVHLSGPHHPAAVHRPVAGPGPGQAGRVPIRPVPGGAGGLRVRRCHPGGGPGPGGAGPGHRGLSPDAAASRPPGVSLPLLLCTVGTLAETARVCGISVPAVKSQLYRTRQGLQTYLEKEGFDV